MATSTAALERQLPQNTEAERSILGAILLDNNALNATLEKLKPEDFFHDHHRRIYQQMTTLGETQQAIDLVTLTDQLHRAGELESSGGHAYISQLMDGVTNVITDDVGLKIIFDCRDGLSLFRLVIGDKFREFVFEQFIFGFESRDE